MPESSAVAPEPIPLLLLAGRDREGTRLPEGGEDKRVLRGYKASRLEINGRPLIAELIERLRRTGAFGPIWVAGPSHLYEDVLEDVHLVDTDGGFGDNLRAGIEALVAALPDRAFATMTSDILPTDEDLQRALDDYRRHEPCDFWMCEMRIPTDPDNLGNSAWKPKYLLLPTGESEPVGTLPGHLVIVHPAGLRLHLIYRIFDLAYRTRNRPFNRRRWGIVRGAFSVLVHEDLRQLSRLRPPLVAMTMLYHGLNLGAKLFRGHVRQEELEDRLRRIWFDPRHLRRYPDRRGRVAILEGLSLARDIDTEEEALEILGALPEDGE